MKKGIEIEEFLHDAGNDAMRQIVRADAGVLEDRFWLPTVDLNAVVDPDEPGLHRRVRAGLGALLHRTPQSVDMAWGASMRDTFGSNAGDMWSNGFSGDYDLVIHSHLETTGSVFGNDRAAQLRMSHSRHVTGSEDVRPIGTADYEPYNYAIGLFSDRHGVPSVIGKLIIWNEPGYSNCLDYQDDADRGLATLRATTPDAHTAIVGMYRGLAEKIEAQDLILR